MEYNQDTGVSECAGDGTNVAVPRVSICWRYKGSGGGNGVVVAAAVAAGLREVGGGIRAFSSTVTYGPFSRDYIQFPDLARKRRLRSPNAAWVVVYRRDTFRAK